MTGYSINNRSRYKCAFCDHKTYKHHSGILMHLEQHHALDYALAKKDAEIERLKNKPPKIEVREKVVYRDPPAKPDPKFWHSGVYCSACKIAYRSVGIPFGQTIEETPHSNCGTRSLMLVNEVVT